MSENRTPANAGDKPAGKARRAPSKKVVAPAIDPNVKPTPEQFDANEDIYKGIWVCMTATREGHGQSVGTRYVVRRVAEKAMELPTGISQPVDAAGNVVRATASFTRDDDRLIDSIVELLRTFPEANKSWVVALRTARWTRSKGIMRGDGTPYLSCTTARWGTNGYNGLYHAAIARLAEQDAAKVKPVRKSRTGAPKPAAKRTTKSA